MTTPLDMLRHHVTGAIQRWEKTAIVEKRIPDLQFSGDRMFDRDPDLDALNRHMRFIEATGKPLWSVTAKPLSMCRFVFTLSRVRINSQGYDRSGCYYGAGAPLWEACASSKSYRFRAADRNAAKALIRSDFPCGKFFR